MAQFANFTMPLRYTLYNASKIHPPTYPGWRGSDVIVKYTEKLAHIKLDSVPLPLIFFHNKPKNPPGTSKGAWHSHHPFQGEDASLLLQLSLPQSLFPCYHLQTHQKHLYLFQGHLHRQHQLCCPVSKILYSRWSMIYRYSPRSAFMAATSTSCPSRTRYTETFLALSLSSSSDTSTKYFYILRLYLSSMGVEYSICLFKYPLSFPTDVFWVSFPSTRLASSFYQTAVLLSEREQEEKD